MRSNWSAEAALSWLAVASMEGAWITLAYIGVEGPLRAPGAQIGIAHFAVSVAAGMFVARSSRDLPQQRFAVVITATAVIAAVAGTLLAGVATLDIVSLVRATVFNPGSWLLGLAVLRGAAHADPGNEGHVSERVFALGVPGLVIFWVVATYLGLAEDLAFTSAAFVATLTFVTAGLLSLGIARLSDLDVEAVDRGARRRWLSLLIGIIGVVLVIGVPLAGILGLPISTALAGIAGPLAPLLIIVFTLLAIPLFLLFDILAGLFRALGFHDAPTVPLASPAASAAAPPPFEFPQASVPPDLTWLFLAVVVVGIIILLRIVASTVERPLVKDRARNTDETRASEPIAMPNLPHIPRLRLRPTRRPAPRNAVEAYRSVLAALVGVDEGRRAGESPREHATRIALAPVGRDVAWLAADYQLDAFAGQRLTRTEERRALLRWRSALRIIARRQQPRDTPT
jgi:hypothetical protein